MPLNSSFISPTPRCRLRDARKIGAPGCQNGAIIPSPKYFRWILQRRQSASSYKFKTLVSESESPWLNVTDEVSPRSLLYTHSPTFSAHPAKLALLSPLHGCSTP